jgi:hypothetical protein
MSLQTAKLFKNPLALAGAALVIHIGAATAGDVQQQARDLLTGTIAAHSAPQSPPHEGKVRRQTADAQQSARALLLGPSSHVGGAERIKQAEVAGASAESDRKAHPVGHGDAQVAARQLLLGQPVASDAPRLTARRAH